jgi:hypothetical protein
MAQLTLYVPDEIEKELRRAAKRAKKSLSAYVVELARQKLKPAKWPASFAATYGTWQGSFPNRREQKYEDREDL